MLGANDRYSKIIRNINLANLHGVKPDMTPDQRRSFVVSTLQSSDPTPTGKYAGWLMRLWANGTLRIEDLGESARETLADFERVKKMGDKGLPSVDRSILRYKTMGELFKTLLPFAEVEVEDTVSGKEGKRLDAIKARNEAYIVSSASGMTIIIPLTRFAAQHYGHQTKWCTSADHSNAFEDYAKETPVVIFELPDGQRFQGAMFSKFKAAQFDDECDDIAQQMDLLEFKNAADDDISVEEAKALEPYMGEICNYLSAIAPDWDTDAVYDLLSPSTVKTIRAGEGEDEDEDAVRCQEEFMAAKVEAANAVQSLESFRHFMENNDVSDEVLLTLAEVERSMKKGVDLGIGRLLKLLSEDGVSFFSKNEAIELMYHEASVNHAAFMRARLKNDLIGGYLHTLCLEKHLTDEIILSIMSNLPTAQVATMVCGGEAYDNDALPLDDKKAEKRSALISRLFDIAVDGLPMDKLADLMTYYRARDQENNDLQDAYSNSNIRFRGDAFFDDLTKDVKKTDAASVPNLMKKYANAKQRFDAFSRLKARLLDYAERVEAVDLEVESLDKIRLDAAVKVFAGKWNCNALVEKPESQYTSAQYTLFFTLKNIINEAMERDLSKNDLAVIAPIFANMLDMLREPDHGISKPKVLSNLKAYDPSYCLENLFNDSLSNEKRVMILKTVESHDRRAMSVLTREQQGELAYMILAERNRQTSGTFTYATFRRAIGSVPFCLKDADCDNIKNSLVLARLSSLFPTYTQETVQDMERVLRADDKERDNAVSDLKRKAVGVMVEHGVDEDVALSLANEVDCLSVTMQRIEASSLHM
mgnify:CR=1 FL=1